MIVGIYGLYAYQRGAYGGQPIERLADLVDDLAAVAWDRDVGDADIPQTNIGYVIRFYPCFDGTCAAYVGSTPRLLATWDPTSRRWVRASDPAARP